MGLISRGRGGRGNGAYKQGEGRGNGAYKQDFTVCEA